MVLASGARDLSVKCEFPFSFCVRIDDRPMPMPLQYIASISEKCSNNKLLRLIVSHNGQSLRCIWWWLTTGQKRNMFTEKEEKRRTGPRDAHTYRNCDWRARLSIWNSAAHLNGVWLNDWLWVLVCSCVLLNSVTSIQCNLRHSI